MRIPFSIKVFLAFLLVLALSLVPAYWYLRRHLREQVIHSAELDLSAHARLVADRLVTVPDDQLFPVVRDLAGLMVDRVTLIASDGRVLYESMVPTAEIARMDNHLDRAEVRAALRDGAGTAIRFSGTKKEPYLYVARTLHTPGGAVRGVIRLSRTLGAIESSLQRALTFLYRTAGAVASLALFMSLLISLYGVRPLMRICQAAQAYVRGDFTAVLPVARRDELGDLASAMAALARRVQQEMVDHSTDRATQGALVRACPLPALLLSPELERQEINAPFREAAAIEPAAEDMRIHALCQTAEFDAARLAAIELGQPQPLLLPLPWRRVPLHALLCPLPAACGRIGWALFIDDQSDADPAEWRDPLTRSRQRGMRQLDTLLDGLSRHAGQDAPLSPRALAARLAELRAALDLLRRADTPPAPAVKPLDLVALLERVLREVQPLGEERRVEVHAELPPAPLLIADAHGFTERALRVALVRAIGMVPAAGAGETVLSLRVHLDDTSVQVQIEGPIGGLQNADLDQLLAALGGAVTPGSEAGEGGAGLLIKVQRA